MQTKKNFTLDLVLYASWVLLAMTLLMLSSDRAMASLLVSRISLSERV